MLPHHLTPPVEHLHGDVVDVAAEVLTLVGCGELPLVVYAIAVGCKGRRYAELAVIGCADVDGVRVLAAVDVGNLHPDKQVAALPINGDGGCDVARAPAVEAKVGIVGIEGEGLGGEEHGILAQVNQGKGVNGNLGYVVGAAVAAVHQPYKECSGLAGVVELVGAAVLPQVAGVAATGVEGGNAAEADALLVGDVVLDGDEDFGGVEHHVLPVGCSGAAVVGVLGNHEGVGTALQVLAPGHLNGVASGQNGVCRRGQQVTMRIGDNPLEVGNAVEALHPVPLGCAHAGHGQVLPLRPGCDAGESEQCRQRQYGCKPFQC